MGNVEVVMRVLLCREQQWMLCLQHAFFADLEPQLRDGVGRKVAMVLRFDHV